MADADEHEKDVWKTVYSFDVLVENFMDPAHIPFAHHGLQGVRSDGSPIAMKTMESNDTHVEVTFADVLRGKPRDGVISFRRPARYHFRTMRDDSDYKVNLEIYAAPIRAGRTRAFLMRVVALLLVSTVSWRSDPRRPEPRIAVAAAAPRRNESAAAATARRPKFVVFLGWSGSVSSCLGIVASTQVVYLGLNLVVDAANNAKTHRCKL